MLIEQYVRAAIVQANTDRFDKPRGCRKQVDFQVGSSRFPNKLLPGIVCHDFALKSKRARLSSGPYLACSSALSPIVTVPSGSLGSRFLCFLLQMGHKSA